MPWPDAPTSRCTASSRCTTIRGSTRCWWLKRPSVEAAHRQDLEHGRCGARPAHGQRPASPVPGCADRLVGGTRLRRTALAASRRVAGARFALAQVAAQPAPARHLARHGRLVDVLRERRFDLVIDAQGLLKSAWWARRVGAPVAGYDRNSIREPVASLLYTQRHEVAYTLHAVTRCRLLAAAALRPHLPPAAQVSSAVQLPAPDFGLQQVQHFEHAALRRPYAVLIPNASRPEKHWPQAHWQALGQRLQAQGLQPVVLWGSHDEQAMAQHIAQGCQGWVPPFLTVQQAAQLLAGAHLVVGLDTGFAHVAAALGRPVVGIYCDHEPGLTGITGNGPGASLGGKGQRPGFDEVLAAVQKVAQAAGLP
ncbi:MAG: lipopolysaccharide heptosyltransferase I [Betaproteobacteria bacterium]|nr:lipopolysaccharide heptosyltransferase I [Betaproteobacteria bacterium]